MNYLLYCPEIICLEIMRSYCEPETYSKEFTVQQEFRITLERKKPMVTKKGK